MSKVTLRCLLSRLTALALSTSAMGASAAAPPPASSIPFDDNDDDADDADLEADLEIDREQIDDYDAALALGHSLALALGELRPLSATHLAATWALSNDPLRRLAVGFALERVFPLVGDGWIIEQLAYDPDPEIRTAAVRAARTRRPSGTAPGVIERLLGDPDPRVRAVAAAAAT